ncbi:hypothetical protein Zmor_012614 [Zophobas morio]|uniref:Uncharacterized protein n=1 Tax=Zophobas morio TaxID=2755281 RepID=A0AA38IDX8_9CUCU|nr:hypothetical protein Zmor_012614 [Zophobas morio]
MLKTVSILLVISLVASYEQRPGFVLTVTKLFWSNSNNGTVSKFPPIIEFFVQRIQSLNSNYVYEDLSRPPTWEKPVYTLAPEDYHLTANPESVTQTTAAPTTTTTAPTTTPDPWEYEELEETTEKFFEVITGSAPRTA